MKKRKINNPYRPKNNVQNLIDVSQEGVLENFLRTNKNIVFDFSAFKCFNSCNVNCFDNFLAGDKDFVEKIKQVFELAQKLSSKTAAELFDLNNNFRHCHKIDGDKEILVQKVLEKLYADSRYVLQNYDGEVFYQAGYEKGVRLIGIIGGNVFKVLVVDYFHSLYPDEKLNTRSAKTNNYSVDF